LTTIFILFYCEAVMVMIQAMKLIRTTCMLLPGYFLLCFIKAYAFFRLEITKKADRGKKARSDVDEESVKSIYGVLVALFLFLFFTSCIQNFKETAIGL
jgi:hypothetical protein